MPAARGGAHPSPPVPQEELRMPRHKLVDQRTFHSAARGGTAGGVGVTRAATVLRADAGDRTVRFVLSDGTVDRMDDTVAGSGWDLTAYRNNPVVLFAHDSSAPPVGRANRVWTDGSRLLGDVEFAPPETYAFADTIYKLVMGGFLKSGSVGFLPLVYKFSDRQGGIDFKRQELLEFQRRAGARQLQRVDRGTDERHRVFPRRPPTAPCRRRQSDAACGHRELWATGRQRVWSERPLRMRDPC
jgi:hypothetical protein